MNDKTKTQLKAKTKANKYNFGGKKHNSKWKNTLTDISEYGGARKKEKYIKAGKEKQRLGKNRRIKTKARRE